MYFEHKHCRNLKSIKFPNFLYKYHMPLMSPDEKKPEKLQNLENKFQFSVFLS